MGITLLAAVLSPLVAAQGQITEVNPSGVHGTVVVLQADEGEEVSVGDKIAFVNPRAFQKGPAPVVDGIVEFEVVKNGKNVQAVIINQATQCPCVGCCN